MHPGRSNIDHSDNWNALFFSLRSFHRTSRQENFSPTHILSPSLSVLNGFANYNETTEHQKRVSITHRMLEASITDYCVR